MSAKHKRKTKIGDKIATKNTFINVARATRQRATNTCVLGYVYVYVYCVCVSMVIPH